MVYMLWTVFFLAYAVYYIYVQPSVLDWYEDHAPFCDMRHNALLAMVVYFVTFMGFLWGASTLIERLT